MSKNAFLDIFILKKINFVSKISKISDFFLNNVLRIFPIKEIKFREYSFGESTLEEFTFEENPVMLD